MDARRRGSSTLPRGRAGPVRWVPPPDANAHGFWGLGVGAGTCGNLGAGAWDGLRKTCNACEARPSVLVPDPLHISRSGNDCV